MKKIIRDRKTYEHGKVIEKLEGKDIPDIYLVKFRPRGQEVEFRYGVVDQFDDEAIKLWKLKILMVDDAIIPFYHKVTAEDFEIIPLDICGRDNEYDKYVEAEYKKAEKVAKKAKGLVGKLFRIGVADGHACYIVTGETARTANVEWRGFGGLDRYHDHAFGNGGTFDKKFVERYVKMEEGLRELFSFDEVKEILN